MPLRKRAGLSRSFFREASARGYPRELFAPLRRSIALEEELTNERTRERNERTERTTGAEKSNKQKMKAGLDRSIARAGLYIDSRGVYETTRRGEGKRGEQRGRRMNGTTGGEGGRGLDGTDRESPATRNFFFEKDEITGQLAILLKICQVSRGPIRDLSQEMKKEIIFLLPLSSPMGLFFVLIIITLIYPV